jgi:hypothetical protein
MDAWQWFGFLTILILFSFCKSVLFRYWLHKEDRSYNDGYDDGFDRGYEDGQESVMDQTGIDDDVPSEITLDRNGRPNGVTEPVVKSSIQGVARRKDETDGRTV